MLACLWEIEARYYLPMHNVDWRSDLHRTTIVLANRPNRGIWHWKMETSQHDSWARNGVNAFLGQCNSIKCIYDV